jgi:DNA-binding CsgD family transcriptional regulator
LTTLLDRAAAALHDAPFAEPEGWSDALALTAEATGSWAAQMIAFSPRTEVLWEWWHNIPGEVIAAFEARMAESPELNPRARVFLRPTLTVYRDDDLIDADARRRSAIYRELYDPSGAPHAGLVQLAPVPDEARLLLAVLRDERRGPLDAEGVSVLSHLGRAWSTALRTKIRLEDHGAALAVGALDAADFPVILIDRSGRPAATSGAADVALVAATHVRVRQGVLGATDPRSDAELRVALAAVLASPARSVGKTVVLDGPAGALLAEITPLPYRRRPTHRSAVAVMVLKPHVRSRRAATALLQRLHNLSAAEAEIALSIASGLAVSDLADLRGVSVGTLRNQLKAIFDKCAVASQAQLTGYVLRRLGDRWAE